MTTFFYYLIWITIFSIPIVLIVFDILFIVKHKEKPIFEMACYITGFIYMALAYFLWNPIPYDKPINTYTPGSVHEPFSGRYLDIMIIAMAIGFASYIILKYKKDFSPFPPLVNAMLVSGVYVGCIYNILFIVQLVCGAHPLQSEEFPHYKIGLRSEDWFIIACLCIVPAMHLFHCIVLMVKLVKETAYKQEQIQYENPVLQWFNSFLIKGANMLWVPVVFLLPVLLFIVIILLFFGQQPDFLLYTFTKTSDWILSKEISPPPVAYDAHYLCTVSLRGHKKLVKPIRYGIRKGEKIVVNRQLCVANAFEELIMEKTPRFHKALRHFYDTYGYPISKHINNAWTADLVYIIMKPLEWFFVAVLYTFDKNPENRICRQYLPKDRVNLL